MRNRIYSICLDKDLQIDSIARYPVNYRLGIALGNINIERNLGESDEIRAYYLHLEGSNDIEVIKEAKRLCKKYKEKKLEEGSLNFVFKKYRNIREIVMSYRNKKII